jgi:ATPase subunit of ABC transporter with duplicated ATPase domains
VLEDISISFYPGAKIGVIGPNGSGKSSLLRIMAGLDDGYNGEARLTPGFSVGMLEQEPQLDPDKDVHGNVMDGVGQVAALLTEYDEVMAGWADPEADYEKLGARQADLEAKIEAAGAWDLQRTIDIAMDALRCPPGDADIATLSGGERRRAEIARSLVSEPRFLLFDEPSAGLSPKLATEALERVAALAQRGVGVLVVEQNIREATRVADRIYVLVGGSNRFEGRPADIADDRELMRMYLGAPE